MEINELSIKGVYEIKLNPFKDHRGFFVRTYDSKAFAEKGLNTQWLEESHSFSNKKNTVRGLHFQFPPYGETKLMRVVDGKIFVNYIDLRKNSSTFGKFGSIILSAEKKNMVYIPNGFANGFCTLTDNCSVLYKISSKYVPESQGSIRWDSVPNITWPVKNPLLSEKDSTSSSFKEFVEHYGGLEL